MSNQQPISGNANKVHLGGVNSTQLSREKPAVDSTAFKAILERLETAARDISKRSESLADTKDLTGVVAEAANSLGDALALRDSVLDAYRGAQQASASESEDAA
jgi:hypothetical protein